MKFYDLTRRAARSLKSAKLRTFLTALAISVGGFTLSITLAATNGAREYTQRLVESNFDPSEMFVGKDPEIANDSAPSDKPQEYDESVGSIQGGGGQANIQVKRIDDDDIRELKQYDFIERVRESFQVNLEYITRPDQPRLTGSIDIYNGGQKPEVRAGELPENLDELPDGSVLLPDTYLEQLGFSSAEDALGREVTLVFEKPITAETARALFTQLSQGADPAALQSTQQDETLTVQKKITAVIKKSPTSFSFGVMPLLVSYNDAREIYDFTTKGTNDYGKYLFVYARVKDGQDKQKVEQAAQRLTEDGYFVQTSEGIQKSITQIIDILQSIVLVFGLITLIASVFGIVNTQYISVLERTREIGLIKSLGMRRKDIMRMFTLEATWIGLLGGSAGALFGLLLGVILNPVITEQLDLGAGNYLLIYKAWQLAVLIFALMLIATFAGLLPALKAARLNPIEALRTE